MTAPLAVAPIRKQLTVDAPQERAFRVFAEKMGTWWLPEHHIGASPFKEIVVEPRAGGRWYELGEDGAEQDWGIVLEWKPPTRLVLGWQLDVQFQLDREVTTEIEVTFTPLGIKRTRIDLEHRNLERLGESAARVAKDMDAGWGQLLDSYAASVAAS